VSNKLQFNEMMMMSTLY